MWFFLNTVRRDERQILGHKPYYCFFPVKEIGGKYNSINLKIFESGQSFGEMKLTEEVKTWLNS